MNRLQLNWRVFKPRRSKRESLIGFTLLLTCALFSGMSHAWGSDEFMHVQAVEAQPLKAQTRRVVEALQYLGQPLSDAQLQQLERAWSEKDADAAVAQIQQALDSRCLVGVHINPESRVKVERGPAEAELDENGWKVYLVKVHNEGGVTAPLRALSRNALPPYRRSTGSKEPPQNITPEDVANRWLDLAMFDANPLVKTLSGLALEYRIVQLYSRDAGKREATLAFDVGQGTQDLGFRNEVPILFECAPSVRVTLRVRDVDGTPTTGQFVIRDPRGNVYPSRTRRLAPDFFFHDQIYRHDGETVQLPPGTYDVTFTRGPEYLIEHRKVTVPAGKSHTELFQLRRWIQLTNHHWFSGDHHVHAAGCAHYEAPTEGVKPEVMMRHILGEDLNVGCVLSWGPCWYFQKQFFEGETHKLSTPEYLMRYDVEVSGFPSQHAGHLCLLRLQDDDYSYPQAVSFDWSFGGERGSFSGQRTERVGEWPSWDLPILQWGKQQGGVVGFSHSGWGLQVPGNKLPVYEMAPFDGIGANEYIVDVVHDACDFISAVDTPAIWELNIWYHTLNCGYTCRISGETDFPCIYGDRVGLGRAYVKLNPDQELNFDHWVQGIKDGRSYCCDGLSHLFDFQVNGLGVGESGVDGRASVLAAQTGDRLNVSVRAAARLEESPREDIRRRPLDQKPYWHVERARIGNTRKVPVELIVNGHSVATTEIDANGAIHELTFDYQLERSSWVALRIFPSCHTNPIFVEVDGKPIRASKRSAQWCLDAVDVCWTKKRPAIRPHERAEAAAAFDVARQAYAKILSESFDDR